MEVNKTIASNRLSYITLTYYYLYVDKVDFDVNTLHKLKVAELRRLCNVNNVCPKGVKSLLVTKLKSFAAGTVYTLGQ